MKLEKLRKERIELKQIIDDKKYDYPGRLRKNAIKGNETRHKPTDKSQDKKD